MRVAISGSRNLAVNRKLLDEVVPLTAEILVGDCPTGVDLGVRVYCEKTRRAMKVFRADWGSHGKAAGPIRNRAMVAEADLLIAFWNGKSRGTLSAISEATKAGVPVRIYPAPH